MHSLRVHSCALILDNNCSESFHEQQELVCTVLFYQCTCTQPFHPSDSESRAHSLQYERLGLGTRLSYQFSDTSSLFPCSTDEGRGGGGGLYDSEDDTVSE